MDNIKLKYIIIVDEWLDNEFKLINLLKSRSTLEIKNGNVFLCDDSSIYSKNFKISKINIKSNSSKQYFIVSLSFDNIDLAERLNREFKKVIGHIDDVQIELLNDGISKYYSVKSYDVLHDVENALRAFITELMVFYGNPNWVKKEAKEILKIKEEDISNKGIKIFYSRNFDQLREFLFTDYSDVTYKQIIEEILYESDINKKKDLVDQLSDKIPRTNWEKLVKSDASKNEISSEQFKKLLENIYDKRNKIAHCNDFNKADFEKFNKDCESMLRQTRTLTEIIESKRSNEILLDHDITEDISAIFSPDESFDTIIVPTSEDGFNEVFLDESRWYSISIYKDRIKYIKYIAAYIKSPAKKISHYAEVDSIQTSPYDEKKKMIIFKNPAIKLNNSIDLGTDKAAFQRSRYTTFDKLKNAKTSDDLF